MLSRLRATFSAYIMRRQNHTDNAGLQALRDSHYAINREAKRRHAERMQAPRVAPPVRRETITIENSPRCACGKRTHFGAC